MAAREGSKTYGSLSIFCQYHALVKMLLKIDRSSFFPEPGRGFGFCNDGF
jgi:16S rRNA A1518/A1519 N6-dimethyltransferase RsmA/KsgA/DIM1 with predicted DNA glycosylase/AP lyase activity